MFVSLVASYFFWRNTAGMPFVTLVQLRIGHAANANLLVGKVSIFGISSETSRVEKVETLGTDPLSVFEDDQKGDGVRLIGDAEARRGVHIASM